MKKKNAPSRVFDDLKQSLNEAIDYSRNKGKARVHRRSIKIAPVPVYTPEKIKRMRERLNFSQKTFAQILGVSIKSIEAWESGRSEANGSAQRMLSIIDQDAESLEKYALIEKA